MLRSGELPRISLSFLLFAALAVACSSHEETLRIAQPSAVLKDRSWVMVPNFPLVIKEEDHGGGAAALSAVLGYWGKPTTPADISSAEGRAGRPLRAGDLEHFARREGLSSYVFSGTLKDVAYELDHGRPVIVGLGKAYEGHEAVHHYAVVVGLSRDRRRVLLLDPGRGWQTDSFEGFSREWSVNKGVTVVAFLSTDAPTPQGMTRLKMLAPMAAHGSGVMSLHHGPREISTEKGLLEDRRAAWQRDEEGRQ